MQCSWRTHFIRCICLKYAPYGEVYSNTNQADSPRHILRWPTSSEPRGTSHKTLKNDAFKSAWRNQISFFFSLGVICWKVQIFKGKSPINICFWLWLCLWLELEESAPIYLIKTLLIFLHDIFLGFGVLFKTFCVEKKGLLKGMVVWLPFIACFIDIVTLKRRENWCATIWEAFFNVLDFIRGNLGPTAHVISCPLFGHCILFLLQKVNLSSSPMDMAFNSEPCKCSFLLCSAGLDFIFLLLHFSTSHRHHTT